MTECELNYLFMEDIKIKYFNKDINKIEQIGIGDWIDLRASEDVKMKAGEFRYIPLGIGMELPEGYEALIAPRSSTFKNYHIIITNSPGVVDNSYCGNDDQWMCAAYALEDTKIHKNDRICQFRLIRNQPKINFIEVKNLDNENRGGFGSTGTK